MQLRRAAIAGLVVGTAAARSVGAQTIRGSVLDGGGRPVAGVVVLMLDSASTPVARALTNERGEYRVANGRAGIYRLRTLRIGYRPSTGEPVRLPLGGEVERSIVLASLHVQLDTIRVVDRSACRIAADTAAAIFSVWEQARTVLSAAQVTLAGRNINATTLSYSRVLDADGRRVLQQSSRITTAYVAQPWRAISADSIHAVGFITVDRDNSLTFHAPSIDVLLAPAFVEDHCFRIVADRRQPGRIGLAFEPSEERRRLPEIAGTLWLDRASSELRRLDYRYVNIAAELHDAGAGGSLEFAPLRTRGWVISRWDIRMPVLEQVVRVQALGGTQNRLTTIEVTGGEIVLATIPNGANRDTLWSRPVLTLTGVAVDSTSGKPVVGATVEISGTNLSAITDKNGRFAIAGLLPGIYSVETSTPELQTVGASSRSSLSFTDSVAQYSIKVPRLAELPTATFAGTVRADSSRVPLVGVEISFPEIARGTRSGSRGEFSIPNIPPGIQHLVVRHPGFGRVDTTIVFRPKDAVDRQVLLSRTQALETVVVRDTRIEAVMRDFNDNRRVGLGKFLDRAQLEADKGSRLSRVITQWPGISVTHSKTGAQAWVAGTRKGPPLCPPSAGKDCFNSHGFYYPDRGEQQQGMPIACFAQVYRDGALMNRGYPTEPFDLGTVNVDDLEAVEWYTGASDTPSRYSSLNSACGVLVLHTRRTP